MRNQMEIMYKHCSFSLENSRSKEKNEDMSNDFHEIHVKKMEDP